MSRPPLPVLARLLPKIATPGPIEPLIHVPIADWPTAARNQPWLWTGGILRAHANHWVTNGCNGHKYLQRTPVKPAFKISGKRVEVHRLIYSIFVGPPSRKLRYCARPADYLDVNPAHWEPRHDPARVQSQNEVEVFDEELAATVETLEERHSLGKPLLVNLIFSREHVEKALKLLGIEADTSNYQPVE